MRAEQGARGRPLRLLQRFAQASISRKYTLGYLLMLVIVVVIFSVSFFTSWAMDSQYQRAMGELLELNGLFVDLENTNRAVYDFYLYLRPASSDSFHRESMETRRALAAAFARMDEAYSREVMDLCCMIETYLDESEALVQALTEFRSAGSAGDNAVLAQAYSHTQQMVSFINQSFQEAYTIKLADTQRVQADISRTQAVLAAFQLLMLALALAVCLVYYRKVVAGLTRSVNRLTEFATGVTRNPALQGHVQIDTGDELAVFAAAFNELVDTVQAQMARLEEDGRVRQQLQQVEMENLRISAALQSSQLKLLQSRVNPHFLFNTLNLITQTAYMEDAPETAALMEATSEFLRYNLGKVTKQVTLKDEIENLRNYILIQKGRFGDRIEFLLQVDEQLAACPAPCMILQPLVENAVSHGVGRMVRGARVTVRLYGGGGFLWLEVEDNGAGIEPARLQQLRESFGGEDDGGHIGLRNVYQRLAMQYGPALRFDLQSRPGRTVVQIGLPLGGGTGEV